MKRAKSRSERLPTNGSRNRSGNISFLMVHARRGTVAIMECDVRVVIEVPGDRHNVVLESLTILETLTSSCTAVLAGG